MQQYAKNSSGVILASAGLSLIIKQYIEQLKSFESCIEIFDAEIEKIYRKRAVKAPCFSYGDETAQKRIAL